MAAALVSILTGHVVWAADTALMLSYGNLVLTSRSHGNAELTFGIADYENAAGDITPLSFWAESHHLC